MAAAFWSRFSVALVAAHAMPIAQAMIMMGALPPSRMAANMDTKAVSIAAMVIRVIVSAPFKVPAAVGRGGDGVEVSGRTQFVRGFGIAVGQLSPYMELFGDAVKDVSVDSFLVIFSVAGEDKVVFRVDYNKFAIINTLDLQVVKVGQAGFVVGVQVANVSVSFVAFHDLTFFLFLVVRKGRGFLAPSFYSRKLVSVTVPLLVSSTVFTELCDI